MKKSDLKDHMLIQTKDGIWRMVLIPEYIIVEAVSYFTKYIKKRIISGYSGKYELEIDFKNYNKNLTFRDRNYNLDIVKVCKWSYISVILGNESPSDFISKMGGYKVLWSKNNNIEMEENL